MHKQAKKIVRIFFPVDPVRCSEELLQRREGCVKLPETVHTVKGDIDCRLHFSPEPKSVIIRYMRISEKSAGLFVHGLLTVLLAAGCSSVNSPVLQGNVSGELRAADLTEASGMAPSLANPGHYWLHNDSTNEARLFLVDETGDDAGSTHVLQGKNVDWEGMASFDWNGRSWLLVADVGDNNARRESLTLYFIAEPALPFARRYPVHHQLELRFPDGPRDCEAVAVDPLTDSIVLLSKRDPIPRLYTLNLHRAMVSNAMTASFQGEVRSIPKVDGKSSEADPTRGPWASQPTSMDISRDGRQIAVLTYHAAYVYQRMPGTGLVDTLNGSPAKLPVAPPLIKAEAVSFSLDGRRLLITTEKQPAPMLVATLPQQATPMP